MPTDQLVHEYIGRGTAVQAFECRAPEVLVSGAAGTGKSRGLLEKIHLAMMKYPRAKALLLRKTMASLASTGLQTWQEFVVAEALLSGEVTYFGGSVREPPQYRYANGSMVAIGGLDNPTKVMSSEYDIVYIQESTELNVKDWEFVSTRLRNGRMPYQQILADANPDAPTHWLKQRCDRGVCVMFNSVHEENPRLFAEVSAGTPGAKQWNNAGRSTWLKVTEAGAAYMARLDALTGVRKLRLRDGLWVAAEGLIYEAFRPNEHVIKRFPIPADWPRFWSVDFGFVNPFVLQCWAQDPDGRLIMYREIYRTGRTVDEHAFDIMAEVSTPDPDWVQPKLGPDGKPFQLMAHHGRIWTEPRPVKIITDHDAEGRRTFERHIGQGTKHADKRVTEGIQQVNRRLRKQESGFAGLFLMENSVVFRDETLIGDGRPASTIEEIPGYVWLKRGIAGGTVNDKKLQDEPLKENDHGCLVAGTLVETSAGPMPIEAVHVGALVATRMGWRDGARLRYDTGGGAGVVH
jgi:hypothetical protein